MRAMDVERARQRAEELETGPDFSRSALCLGLSVVLPILEELRPEVEEAGRKAIPGILRWLLGGLVDDIYSNLLGALREWKARSCNGESDR